MASSIPASASSSLARALPIGLQVRPRLGLPRNWLIVAGMAWLVMVVVCVAVGDRLAPYPPLEMGVRLRPPDQIHVFGTDNFGRDILARVMLGARVSIAVGVLVAGLSSALGAIAGLVTAEYRRLDGVLMRILDGFMAFPATFLAIGLIAALGAGIWQEVIALTVVFFPRTTRLMRGAGLQVRGRPFVEAAIVIGGTRIHIVFRHVLPNTLGPLIVQGSYVLARAVVTESGLSFLGLGLPPPAPSWGNMLGDARTFLQDAWWFTTFPGLAIVLTVLSVNLAGDALRDKLDPRLR